MGKNWVKGAKKLKLEPRTSQEISAEYTQLCSKVGHARYQIELLNQDITKNVERMSKLNEEMFERKALDDKQTAQQQTQQALLAQPQETSNG